MAQQAQVLTPDGQHTYYIYNDNREVTADYDAGILYPGIEIIYRSSVCEVLEEFTDMDGVKYIQLLMKGGIGGGGFKFFV